MPPETRYTEGQEKGQIAYQVVGEGPIDLVYMSGGASHIDMRWDSPRMAAFLERLASFSRLILFDRRGTGASEPIPGGGVPTWEEWADDITTVLNAAGSERAAILAVLDAGPTGMLFAAANPDRTRALVLVNTWVRFIGTDELDLGVPAERADALIELLTRTWGTEEGVRMVNPSLAEDDAEVAWIAKYSRAGTTPAAMGRIMRANRDMDLRQILPTIRVPTLVMQSTGFGLPVGSGRFIAEHIDGAAFVELPGADRAITHDTSGVAIREIEQFLTGSHRLPDADRVFATVLLSDLVDSTRRAADVGDSAWRGLLDRHDDIVRREVGSHRGRLVRSTGDGVVATFDTPGRAIRCSLALCDALRRASLPVRVGLHAGEVELRGDDIGGIAVHIAARVSALAGPGEVLVSRTLPDLVAGSGFEFSDRGVHSLKGVPGEWQVYAVRA